MYTYSEELFSDFHKDAYGFRPRNHRFYDADTTPAEKQEIWDATGRAFDRHQAWEARREREALLEFHDKTYSLRSCTQFHGQSCFTAIAGYKPCFR